MFTNTFFMANTGKSPCIFADILPSQNVYLVLCSVCLLVLVSVSVLFSPSMCLDDI